MSDTKELTKEINQDKGLETIEQLKNAIQELVGEQEDDDVAPPLAPEEFEKALQEVDALGLTFTPELYPDVIAKRGNSEVVDRDKIESLERKYPELPREVGLVIYNTLASQKIGLEIVGGLENFEKKSEIVKRLLITNELRDEFYFRNAIKVPYFESIDWEVVLKTHERGVNGTINVPYALLLLTFHNTNSRIGKLDEHQNVTVAVNQQLVDKLIDVLGKIKNSLEESEKLRDILSSAKSLTE